MYSNANFQFSQVSMPRGLFNLGNTCYINAILQGLQGLPKFNELLTNEYYANCNVDIIQELSRLMFNLNKITEEPFNPSDFRDAVQCRWEGFVKNRQMDCEEFFTFLLGTLHDELKTEVDPPDPIDSQTNVQLSEVVVNRWRRVEYTSPIELLFHIQTVTFLYCPTCKYQHGQYDDVNNHLTVPVEKSVEDCLQAFFSESILEDGKCNSCGALGLKHSLSLGRLPPLLVVHLKRFQDNYDGTFTKINSDVDISPTLDVKPYTVKGLQSSHIYKLIGVTHHHGKSLEIGHYTTVMYRGDRLISFDDTRVNNASKRMLYSSTSYVLWYELEKVEGELPFDSEKSPSLDSQPSQQSSPNAAQAQHSSHTQPLPVDVTHDNGDFNDEASLLNYSNENISSDDMFSDGDDQEIFNEELTPYEITSQIQSIHITEPSPPDCNHAHFDLDIMDPLLSEEEVPGAQLVMDKDKLKKYLKSDLERWLECRRIIKTGSKDELIERILNHQKKEKSKWVFPGTDGGKWYELKRKKLMEQSDSPSQRLPMMPLGVSIFKPFPSAHIPNGYSIEKVEAYLQKIPLTRFSYENGVQSEDGIEPDEEGLVDFSQPSHDDRKNLFVRGTMKRATQFVDSGRVLSVTDCERGDHYFVKADVHASYRNHIYKISIMISKKSGSVCFAECCCKAKALGRCCHVMAVLLLISHHVEIQGHEAVTCTGRICYWLPRGSTAHRQPELVREQSQYYPKTKYHRRGHFDPRPTDHQVDTDEELVRNFHQHLSQDVSKCLWYFQLLEPSQSQITTQQETSEFPDIDLTEQLAEQCNYLLWNLNSIRVFSSSRPLHFSRTKEQSGSQFWLSERAVRMPASEAKTILGLGDGMLKFMRKHMWGLEPFKNAAMKRGTDLEPEARDHYRKKLKEIDPLFDVLECGVWVNPSYPQLSCSPDGLVIDTNGICKLLEIKCPAVLEEMDPKDWEDLPSGQRSSFCLTRCKNTGELKLKPTNKWYYQIQMSMDIMKVDTCDFVVYSTVDEKPKSLTVTVPYDESFWKEKRERLIKIHREWFVPEYFLQNTVFNRQPQQLIYSPSHEDHEDLYFGDATKLSSTFSIQNESEFLIENQEEEEDEDEEIDQKLGKIVNIKNEPGIVLINDDD